MSEWRVVKLELARTEAFPSGSPGRSYLIRLPLDENGLIDELARAFEPHRATVRRFWANEPDQSGYIIKVPNGWAFSYAVAEDDDEPIFHLEDHPIRDGEYLTLTEPDGTRLPFRVVSMASA